MLPHIFAVVNCYVLALRAVS